MARCYIALGSNLEQPLAQVRRAVDALAALPDTQLVTVSPWFRTRAQGPGEQPDYINGVAVLDSLLEPLALLRALQAIEADQGRVREQRWGARTLDLDLLLYGDRVIDEPDLTVPHPRMLQRQFVLQPLLAVAPDLAAPDGRRLAAVAAELEDQGVCLLATASSHKMAGERAATAGERTSGPPPTTGTSTGDPP